MPCAFNYPTSVPIDCIQEAIAILRAGSYQTEAKQLAHSVWTIQGFLQNTLIGAPSPVVTLPAADASPGIQNDVLPREMFAALHGELVNLTRSPAATTALPGDLLSVIRDALLPLLITLLSKWLGG